MQIWLQVGFLGAARRLLTRDRGGTSLSGQPSNPSYGRHHGLRLRGTDPGCRLWPDHGGDSSRAGFGRSSAARCQARQPTPSRTFVVGRWTPPKALRRPAERPMS